MQIQTGHSNTIARAHRFLTLGKPAALVSALFTAFFMSGCGVPWGVPLPPTPPPLAGNITISPNSGVTTGTALTAIYSGAENGVVYQWKKGGIPISGETGTTYTPAEAGRYTVTVRDAQDLDSKTSNAVDVTPSIDVTGITLTSAATVTVGTILNLTAAVAPANASRQTIVWSISADGTGTAIDGNTLTIGSTPGIVTVKAAISGGKSGGTEDFTDEFDITANNAVNAAAPAANTITTNPSPAAILTDETLTMTSNAASADGGTLRYQWYVNATNSNTGGTSLGSADGADTAAYTRPAGLKGTYYYYCEVTNTIPDNGDGGAKSVTAPSSVVTVTVTPAVYVAGYYNDSSTGLDVAWYWKDGAKTDLSSDGVASGITVSGGSVYIAGYDFNGSNYVACYWKDGYKIDLTPSDVGFASAITVSGGSVYVAGNYNNGSTSVACYWKIDGGGTVTRTPLTTGGGNAAAITVSGGSVYAAGGYDNSGTRMACYWKIDEGTPVAQTNLTTVAGYASAITVSGGSIYVVGYYDNSGTQRACYWKIDGTTVTPTDLTTVAGYASAITVSDGSVYMAGYYNNTISTRTACYWKIDGGTPVTKTDLITGGGNASAITVSGGSVYAAGNYYNSGTYVVCYWKDGDKIDIPVGGDAETQGIFVVE